MSPTTEHLTKRRAKWGQRNLLFLVERALLLPSSLKGCDVSRLQSPQAPQKTPEPGARGARVKRLHSSIAAVLRILLVSLPWAPTVLNDSFSN